MADRHGTSRRQWLAACAGGTAGIAGLAGCIDGGDGNGDDDGGGLLGGDGDGDSGENGPEQLPGWPMYGADHRSSGSHPDTTGPTGEVQERWSKEYDAWIAQSATPVVKDGVLYVGWKDASFRAIDVETGDVIWDRQFEGWNETITHSALVVEDTVYVSWTEALLALDVSDGSERWSTEHDTKPRQLSYYDDAIYATKVTVNDDVETGRIQRYDPVDGAEEVVHEFESDQISESLAIADDVAYVGVDDEVVAVDVASGEENWRWAHPEGDPMFWSGVAVADGLVYATSGYGNAQNELPGCFAIGIESGKEEWRYTPDTPYISRPPAVSDGVVYLAEFDLRAVDAASGEERWTSEEAEGFSKPTIVDGTVYGWGQALYAVSADSGDVEWTWDASRSGVGREPMVTVHDGAVFLFRGRGIVVLEGT